MSCCQCHTSLSHLPTTNRVVKYAKYFIYFVVPKKSFRCLGVFRNPINKY